MSAAIGCQPWDTGPLAAMKAFESDNPGYDPQIKTYSYIRPVKVHPCQRNWKLNKKKKHSWLGCQL